jgi:pimeloyl-ACP methyl ester carboxylesterase
MKRPRTHYAKAGDVSIAYQAFGDGPIDLLWAQGWATHIEYAWESPDYSRFLNKLSRFARVVFFDKRGVGMSDRDVGYPTLEERSQDINAVLDAVGSNRVAVFGASEGGAISTVFAATHPERVSHLILNGSRARYKWAPDYPMGFKPDELRADIDRFSTLEGDAANFIDGAPSIANDPAAIDWLHTYFRYSASPRALKKLTQMNYEIDYRGVLAAIQTPTLILHRIGERWCSVDHAHYLAEHIPGSTLRILQGDDHIAWYGDQDSMVSEIRTFITGEAVSASTGRALLTLVFLDIVSSTEHLSRIGDERWSSVLEQLDHVVDRRLAAFGGKKVKHTGDGFLLSFRGPTSALECAIVIRNDVARLGLKCRTGVHTGECEIREEDLSGMTVHVAARVMDAAKPDEILTSQTVKDMALGAPLEFSGLGSRSLRGIPGEWTLFSVNG